jgi:ribosomal protein S12 methylthiotransferase
LRQQTAAVITLGCPKNRVDSEHILGVLGQAGYALTAFPEQADVVVVNTCGFLESAVQESCTEIRRCLGSRRPGQQVVIAGCLVERMSQQLAKMFPDAAALVGILDIRELPAIVGAGAKTLARARRLSRCSTALPRLVSTPRHYAYLRIADGCDNCCAYCLIPSIRGRFRSRPLPELVAEAEALVRQGVRELILIAQDTTLYGQDFAGRKLLPELLRALSGVEGVEELRLLYTHPSHFTQELVDEFVLNPNLLKYVDLPLQHVNDRLLARMNRPYQRAEVESLLERLALIPEMAVRTTFITGFPGETESQFKELLEFVQAGHFAHVGCFAFSPEPGTRAARMRGQVPTRIAEQRAKKVMAVQRRISLRRNQALVGKTVLVRTDHRGAGGSGYLGRTYADAPEIDDVVHVQGRGIRIGERVRVRVERAGPYDLFAYKEE